MASTRAILDLMAVAESSESHDGAVNRLREAVALADNAIRDSQTVESYRIKAQSLSLLLREEIDLTERRKGWLQLAIEMSCAPRVDTDANMLEVFCQVLCDALQDSFTSDDLPRYWSLVQTALRKIESFNRDSTDSRRYAWLLLCRQSSLLRHRAPLNVAKSDGMADAQRALESAKQAIQIAKSEETLLELAHAAWACARYATNGWTYKKHVLAAETALTDPLMRDRLVPNLALARIFRLTFRPALACDTFALALRIGQRRRLVLRQSHVLGESAILLSRDSTEQRRQYWLEESKDILEVALSHGLSSPRNRAALAHVVCLLGPTSNGDCVLDEFGRWRGQTASSLFAGWQVLRDSGEDLQAAAALNIADSAVLNRLGTIQRERGDASLSAEALYRTAIQHDQRDPVPLTNLARVLIERGDERSLSESERLLQRAASFADFRFQFWRRLLETIRRQVPAGQRDATQRRVHPNSAQARLNGVRSIRELEKVFREVEASSDPQFRGHALERIVATLASLTIGMSSNGGYRARKAGYNLYVDGFIQSNCSYRLECKWTKSPIAPNHLVIFHDKLDVDGIAGLMISMAGFSETAIAAARAKSSRRAIILMDGDELRAAITQTAYFDEQLRIKRLELDMRSNPYFRVLET